MTAETTDTGRPTDADRLAEADLARLSACPEVEIRRFVELGLIEPSPDDGAFERGDVTRVRLLVALERSGIDLGEVADAVRRGRLSLRFAGEVVAEPVGLTGRTHAEALAAIGLDTDFAHRLQLALGLPTTSPDDPVREDDLELFSIVAGARAAGLADEPLLGALRAFGINVRQIVEIQRELFRREVEDRLLESGVEHPDMLEAAAATRLRLQRMGYRTIFLLLRRFLERAVFENLVDRLEEALEEHAIDRPDEEPLRTIVFVDLSGYTRLTEETGDERAAEYGWRLIEIALDRSAARGGRLVKTLGDGAMLVFRRAADAVAAALEIVARVEAEDLPPARAGIATGPVVQREGDCFGRTVNLAARLVDAAEPGQALASATAVEEVGEEGPAFRPVGELDLEGLDAPTAAYSASRSSR